MLNASSKGTAVVTGASGGIGAVYADRLAQRGYDLLLVARDGNRLNAVADKLTTQHGVKVEAIVADLTHKPALLGLEARLKKTITSPFW